jgi:superfamily II DNA or RNA helicase
MKKNKLEPIATPEQSVIFIEDRKYAKFITTDISLFNKLRKLLSFKTQGVEYTAAFKNGWNGITYLLDKNGYFLLGLLKKVQEFLDQEGVKYIVSNLNKPIVNNISIDLTNKLNELKLVPRYYQNDIVEACLKNNKGIVRACTAAGKSLVTALVTAHFNKPTILYVIGLDLLQQFHNLFSRLFDEKIGFIGNGVCDIQRINIASIWSVSSALKNKAPVSMDDDNEKELAPNQIQAANILNMLKKTNVHIFDESHVITTDTIKSIFSKIDPEYIYGFSGTPFRDDGSDLMIHGILGEQIINVTASQLIKDGFLAQPIIKFVRVPKTYIGSGTSNYQTVYKEYVTENAIRNKLIVENTRDLLTKGYQVLCLFKHLNHGKNLREMFDDEGINYEFLSGVDPLETRNEVKERLLSKKSNLVLASTIFDIGVDIPSLNALILAGSGKSFVKSLQRCGRVIRSYPGKKYAAIVDFYDDVRYLKGHSKTRYSIYKSEDGFKILNTIKELK